VSEGEAASDDARSWVVPPRSTEGRGGSDSAGSARSLFSLRNNMMLLFGLMAVGFIGGGLWTWISSTVPDAVEVEGTIAKYERDGSRETMTISFVDPESGESHTIEHRRKAPSGPLAATGDPINVEVTPGNPSSARVPRSADNLGLLFVPLGLLCVGLVALVLKIKPLR